MRSRVTLRLVASIEFRAMDLFFIANYILRKHGKESLERSRIREQKKKRKEKDKKKGGEVPRHHEGRFPVVYRVSRG